MKYIVKTNNPFLSDMPRYAGIETENAREVADYILENAGSSIEEEYDDVLDDCYGEIDICGYTYAASIALYRADEVAYNCGKNDYIDGRASDMAYDLERMNDGEEEEYYGYTVTAIEKEEEENAM